MRDPLLWILVGLFAREVVGLTWRGWQGHRSNREVLAVSDKWRAERGYEFGKKGREF